jgi:hypothetical protein
LDHLEGRKKKRLGGAGWAEIWAGNKGEVNLEDILDFLLTNAEESVKINFAVTQGAGVAQLAEQLICNQQVGGSIPFTSSILYFIISSYGGVPEWPKGADCKSVVVDFGGSNPPSSTIISTIVERTNPHSITSGDLLFLFELSGGLEVHVASVFIYILTGFVTNAFTEHWAAKDLLNLGSQFSKFYPKKVLSSQSGFSSPPTCLHGYFVPEVRFFFCKN